jgi:hypothetical protein
LIFFEVPEHRPEKEAVRRALPRLSLMLGR